MSLVDGKKAYLAGIVLAQFRCKGHYVLISDALECHGQQEMINLTRMLGLLQVCVYSWGCMGT